MPCIHKFVDDLTLEKIDFNPLTLIVGTFNPDWNNLGNTAQWFYGRTRNNYFWDVLPRLYGEDPLRLATATEWKGFCRTHQIALTDLIASIDDADEDNAEHLTYLKNYRDDLIAKHFSQFSFVDIPQLLIHHPTLKQVYLTRSSSDAFWRRLWQPVEAFCQAHEISCKTLLTPSGGARFRIHKDVKVSLGDFIVEQWRNQWHLR